MPSAVLRFVLPGLLAIASVAHAGQWPQWRGPEGDGTCRETGLPVKWSETAGVVWRCPLPAWGNSTPAVWDDAIFLTSHVDNRDLVLLKISRATGKIQWTRTVGSGRCERGGPARGRQKFHASQNMASPSPATDGSVVIAHFGNGDLAAYDYDGRQLWKRNLQKDYGDYTIWWGHANSPVLVDGLVVSICLQDSCKDLPGKPSPSYVVAHDARTGQERWKTPRPTEAAAEAGDSYITPILRRSGTGDCPDFRAPTRSGGTKMGLSPSGDTKVPGQGQELIVLGGQILDAYEPATGRRLWNLPGLIGSRTITGPVAAHGMIYATQGMRQPLVAVRPGGLGQRPHEDVVWTLDHHTPDTPTPVASGPWLFVVANDGIAQCLDAKSGRVQWKERLKGEYRASPLAAEGRIYFLNTAGLCTIVAAAPRFQRLQENPLDDETNASPAVADGRLYFRGRKWLYCIGK